MKGHALYGGSFDPLTNGHMWVIETAAKMFETLNVAVGVNPNKTPMFTAQERVDMIREAVERANLTNVQVMSFEKQYLLHVAVDCHADYMVRGIRNPSDYAAEIELHRINANLSNGYLVTTVLLPTPAKYEHISSSTVKGLIGFEGWQNEITQYLPPAVYSRIIKNSHDNG